MRFYLASNFKRKHQLEIIKYLLEEAGHTVNDVWWNVDRKNHPEQDDRIWHGLPSIKAVASRHWKAISESDALILISSEEQENTFTGANIELGYALGKGITCFSYGKIARSGMYSPVIQCHNLMELTEAIEIFSLKV